MVEEGLTLTVYIGSGSGFAGDRSDAAVAVVEALAARGADARFLVFETLAERTLALAHLERRRDPTRGYSRSLDRFLRPVLDSCLLHGIRIVTNMGAANPEAAASRIMELARELGSRIPRVAVITGDDVTGAYTREELAQREVGDQLLKEKVEIVSANVYLGALPIAHALNRGAEVVVTGRVADPALVLGPLVHAHGWKADEWDRLAAGTLAGHLLECGGQITGGYFADPGVKDVPGLSEIGYPIAEIEVDGTVTITKPMGSGGVVDRRTVTEQLLYEIHDPAAYLTPDVTLDLTFVEMEPAGPDRVLLQGARGRPPPDTLKATVCVDGGYLAEAEISYAGPNAAARAQLAISTVRERMSRRAPSLILRADALGVSGVLADDAGVSLAAAWPSTRAEDIRVRFAAQGRDTLPLELLLDEVEALYCAGPAGGAGVRRRLVPRVFSASCLVDRARVKPEIRFPGERG